ncbi:putative membrane protein [Proteiniborus sp. DW1]|uniref:DUF368 domain-containing protein n=1 Tax=Proteiniborus sp. DW1 TaxID=1889883 RepID=UPI00092E09C0|nr:DUF368 domain-containing protein [Proteiniborus sp. DW1]SCG84195.1 putative membrane protein [Proteiniborus sp. DW1]
MKFLIGFLKGMALSVGAIAPGVSGGTLAVIFGIYERITDAIAHVFKSFKENVVFFFPIALGGGFGILVFSRLINYLFKNYNIEVKYLFIGLIIGTFPTLFKQANKKGFKYSYLIPFIITLGIAVVFSVLEGKVMNIIPNSGDGILHLIIYGSIIGFGTIIPGVSASFILMYIGAYELVLDSIASINIQILFPLGIGFVLSIVLFARLISWLFKRAFGYTNYAVLGFVIGSIIPIFPGFQLDSRYLIGLGLFIVGLYVSLYLSKYEKAEK